jgi:ATP-dependent RNA helicase SUPV3L1/SUV3
MSKTEDNAQIFPTGFVGSLSLGGEGQVLYQKLVNNPMLGEVIGKISKGASPLDPDIEIESGDHPVRAEIAQAWLTHHIGSVLDPLMKLQTVEAQDDLAMPVKSIAKAVYEGMGIVRREVLESVIAALDTDMRASLRALRIRLGPILVFMPDLNKPAAVRLRALLWSLWHEADLPAPVPADGVVSVSVDADSANPDFYQAIGYPLYGKRVIRIDMLDRVICAVYDSAEGGQFQAQHQMAEWLGCSIEDLYAALEAMGHRKQDEKKAAQEAKNSQESSGKAGEEKEEGQASGEKGTEEKPELAVFYLKRGKAFETSKPRAAQNKRQKPAAKKSGKKDKKRSNKPKDKGPRVVTAEAEKREEDNPFAVLKQLK